ncbi:MAG: Na(+)-translocating NADH-quinone reductase subunit C [Gammaproteobacteria bacterium]|nr:Na(+)-translocating NADH-quinone reductase subunit C [Gammaproteobacteria bacterium]MDD9816186.1 Na(+)-translocating NADH-quinone reductase subunit C [Gammaproteobacteria bacterium]MDD9870875.1 Na(+)-translocating NADH-quinone reductase subunit C [Gammaproteobacteria bacterium]
MADHRQQPKKPGLIGRFLAMANDSTAKTVIVTVGLCLVCSVIVSVSAVTLKPRQIYNKELDLQKNILEVAGLTDESQSVAERLRQVEARVVDLASGAFADLDAAGFDQRQAARDPARSVTIAPPDDLAGIGRRARRATVYFVRGGDGGIRRLILPVHGYGLWGTLYGFVSLQPDADTVYRLKFYEHKETPGLGGEVDNPGWRRQWHGKKIFSGDGAVGIEVATGVFDHSAPEARHKVDGLSGASITSRGVTNLFRYWMGDHGFGPFLSRWRAGMRP